MYFHLAVYTTYIYMHLFLYILAYFYMYTSMYLLFYTLLIMLSVYTLCINCKTKVPPKHFWYLASRNHWKHNDLFPAWVLSCGDLEWASSSTLLFDTSFHSDRGSFSFAFSSGSMSLSFICSFLRISLI